LDFYFRLPRRLLAAMSTLEQNRGSPPHSRPKTAISALKHLDPLTSEYYRDPKIGFLDLRMSTRRHCMTIVFRNFHPWHSCRSSTVGGTSFQSTFCKTFYFIRSIRLVGYYRLGRSHIIDRGFFTAHFDIQAHNSARRYHMGRSWSAPYIYYNSNGSLMLASSDAKS